MTEKTVVRIPTITAMLGLNGEKWGGGVGDTTSFWAEEGWRNNKKKMRKEEGEKKQKKAMFVCLFGCVGFNLRR